MLVLNSNVGLSSDLQFIRIIKSKPEHDGHWFKLFVDALVCGRNIIKLIISSLLVKNVEECTDNIIKFLNDRIIPNRFDQGNEKLINLITRESELSSSEISILSSIKCLNSLINIIMNNNLQLNNKIERIQLEFDIQLDENTFKSIEYCIYKYCCIKITKETQRNVLGYDLDFLSPEEARLKQLSILIPKYDNMPFINSKSISNEIISHISNRFTIDEILTTFKSNHPIHFFIGSSGLGKTRTAIEYLTCIKQYLTKEKCYLLPYLENKFELYLRFDDNFNQINNIEGLYDFEKYIVERLFYIFFSFYSNQKITNLKVYIKLLANQYPSITKCILYLKSLIYKESPKMMVHIVIDDCHKLIDKMCKICNEDKSYLDQMCTSLGEASCQLARHDILLISTFTGTHYSQLDESCFSTNSFKLFDEIIHSDSTNPITCFNPTRPIMNIIDILDFVKHFINTHPIQSQQCCNLTLNNYTTHSNLLKCIQKCYTLPKRVECLMISLLRLSNGSNSIFNNWDVVSTLISSYSFPTLHNDLSKIADKVFAYSIIEKEVTRETLMNYDISIAYLEENRYITLIPHPTIINHFKIHLCFCDLILIGLDNPIFQLFVAFISDIIINKGGIYNLSHEEQLKVNSQFEIVLNECYKILSRDDIYCDLNKKYTNQLDHLLLLTNDN